MIHIVQQGESIYSIALNYGVSPLRLAFDNQIDTNSALVPGQALLVLIPEIIHVVKGGETLYSIALSYNVTVKDIVKNNPFLLSDTQLKTGEIIVIQYQNQKNGVFEVNGYAYPFINSFNLIQTLPYLTALSVFSYGFTSDGTLIPTDDSYLLESAKRYGVKPILVLTPKTADEAFNNSLINSLVQNPIAQENIINNLLYVMKEKEYSGLDMDFEYILAENRDAYSDFILRLTEIMNANGFTVSVALAPKTSSEQKGLLYEGIDYARLGYGANSVLIMTYEWGYTFGPPMAVAPIRNVIRVVEYAVSQIPSLKIDLGVPNYGYDWPLPFVQGETAARVIGNPEAIEIAKRTGSTIHYDELSQTPYFEYTENGVDHVVWFEDVRSLQEKINLIETYNLRGLGYWNLMKYFRSNWLLLNMY